MQNKKSSNGSVDGKNESTGQNVSLDVLCRRAERLIDSVRMMGEQVEHQFSRPQRVIDDANQAAKSLLELRKQIEDKMAQMQTVEQTCSHRVDQLKGTIPTIHKSAEALIQRVMRARELTDTFGKMMESSADKIALLKAASDEAAKARSAIDNAIAELTRVQKAADNWTGSMSALTAKHVDLIATGNAAASRLRTITDAGERLGEKVRQDIVALRELLRESRYERMAWEQLLARMPAAMDKVTLDLPAPAAEPEADNTKAVPVALAGRVKKLADLVRQATGTPPSACANPRPAANRLSEEAEPLPVSVGADAD